MIKIDRKVHRTSSCKDYMIHLVDRVLCVRTHKHLHILLLERSVARGRALEASGAVKL